MYVTTITFFIILVLCLSGYIHVRYSLVLHGSTFFNK